MSVQDLNRVHRRYIRVSNFFKAAWTFRQFIQGLQKVFTDLTPFREDPDDFQSIYGALKLVSQNLSESAADAASAMLDDVERKMVPLVQGLLAVDDQVSPGLLRLFFQRVKNYDANILTQLVKFYLYSMDGDLWRADRLDKGDFLATRLAEEYSDSRDTFMLRDPAYLREVAQGFFTALGAPQASEAEVVATRDELLALGRRIEEVESMDELHERRLIALYRDRKHSLNERFFHPKILHAIWTTNLKLKNRVHQLYRQEEQRIVAEYQQVFELERDVPIDVQLGKELSQFRVSVERFEEQLQGENLRLEDLAQLRRKVRELVPRLQRDVSSTGPFVQPVEVREFLAETSLEDIATVHRPPADADLDFVQSQFDAIIATLDDTNPTTDPRKVALQPEVFSLGIGAREILAYRRLYGGVTCDHDLEQFILEAAALRARIEQEVDDIKGILDDSAVSQDAPVFSKARRTARRGDLYLKRFAHRIEQAVLDSDGVEAKQLQLLKMRMMRAYSGLWLMVHRS